MYQTSCSPLACFGQEYLVEVWFMYNEMHRFKECSFISFDTCMHLHIQCLYQVIDHFYHPRKISLPVNPHPTSDTTTHLISFTRVILPVLIFLGNGITLYSFVSYFFQLIYFLWDSFILLHILAVSFHCYILVPCVNKIIYF